MTKFKFIFRKIELKAQPSGGKALEASEPIHTETGDCETIPAAEKMARDIAAKKKFYVRSVHQGPDNEVLIYTQDPPERPAAKAVSKPGQRLSPAKRKKLASK